MNKFTVILIGIIWALFCAWLCWFLFIAISNLLNIQTMGVQEVAFSLSLFAFITTLFDFHRKVL